MAEISFRLGPIFGAHPVSTDGTFVDVALANVADLLDLNWFGDGDFEGRIVIDWRGFGEIRTRGGTGTAREGGTLEIVRFLGTLFVKLLKPLLRHFEELAKFHAFP